LRKACGKGIDIYFDNVGGQTLDLALALIKDQGRIALCGASETYNNFKQQ
jgi:NADPH-dependent curcumin reductase CurA